MDIFRDRGRGRKRGRRPGRQPRGQRPQHVRRRHHEPVDSPLNELVSDERVVRPDTSPHRKPKGDSPLSRVSLGHIAFMLAGLLLGAGLFFLVSFLLKNTRAPAVETKAQEKAAPVQVAPAAPPKQVYQSTSPLEAVRVMLKASLAGDKDTAYGQWDINPSEAGTVKEGHAVSVAEMTDKLYEARDEVPLGELTFSVKSQSGDQAQVEQKRGAVVLQVFSLRRHGAYWKISYASPPG